MTDRDTDRQEGDAPYLHTSETMPPEGTDATNLATTYQDLGEPLARSGPLPPDVEAERKQRINNDLVTLFSIPCPVGSTASMKGIGLYTHVAGPPLPEPRFPHEKYKTSDPVLMPIGGPRRMRRGTSLEAHISSDIKNVWVELQQAVHLEELNFGHGGFDTRDLMKRYGASTAPTTSSHLLMRSNSLPQPQLKQSLGQTAGQGSGTLMGGMNEGRRASASATTTHNTYDEERDPRGRKRQRPISGSGS